MQRRAVGIFVEIEIEMNINNEMRRAKAAGSFETEKTPLFGGGGGSPAAHPTQINITINVPPNEIYKKSVKSVAFFSTASSEEFPPNNKCETPRYQAHARIA